MMTRREKLLVRPWQLRRYNNHKKKIINATPIVDLNPPPQRNHVAVKLKKLQKEQERQMKIQEDNFKLLQHLGTIMRKKRVNDYWETEPPTFLRRVSIYPRTRTPTICEETTPVSTPEASTTKKSKCFACSPHRKDAAEAPEVRIPWEPPKKILTKRLSKSAVVPVTSDFDFPKDKHRQVNNRKCEGIKLEKSVSGKNTKLPLIAPKKVVKIEGSNQKIVFRQGPIQIAVKFPSFSEVKIVSGNQERFLQRSLCQCRGFEPSKAKSAVRNSRTKKKI